MFVDFINDELMTADKGITGVRQRGFYGIDGGLGNIPDKLKA
jgi:hypothetical protein